MSYWGFVTRCSSLSSQVVCDSVSEAANAKVGDEQVRNIAFGDRVPGLAKQYCMLSATTVCML